MIPPLRRSGIGSGKGGQARHIPRLQRANGPTADRTGILATLLPARPAEPRGRGVVALFQPPSAQAVIVVSYRCRFARETRGGRFQFITETIGVRSRIGTLRLADHPASIPEDSIFNYQSMKKQHTLLATNHRQVGCPRNYREDTY